MLRNIKIFHSGKSGKRKAKDTEKKQVYGQNPARWKKHTEKNVLKKECSAFEKPGTCDKSS